jgi:hypothetical protein
MRSLRTRSLLAQRRSRADEVGAYPLVCLERGVKADRQSRTRKQLCVGKMNWMIESACHAGRLGDKRTPVGSGRFRDHAQDAIGVLGMTFSSTLALREEDCEAQTALRSSVDHR